MHRCDSISDAVVDLHQNRPPTVGETFDDPALPKRSVTIEPRFHRFGRESVQLRVVARGRKSRMVDVVGEIEAGILDPLRGAQVQGIRAQHLPEPWHCKYSLGKARQERVIVGHRSFQNRHGTHCQADVPVGVWLRG